MNRKTSFTHMFRAGIFKFEDAFDVFNASLLKVFIYFVVINLMMLLPISVQIMGMQDFDYARFGMNFATTEIPDWLPEDLPTSCEINFDRLDCGMDHIFEYDLDVNGTNYHIYLNVPNDKTIKDNNSVAFFENWIDVNIRGSVVRLSYTGFNGTVFEEFQDMEQEEAAAILFERFFQSVKPVIVLPLMIFGVGALFLMNTILIFSIAGLSTLFRFNQSEFPPYRNLLKLFMIASTIPALISLLLGFAGLSAFTSLTYNFITPVIAYIMYRKSRIKLMVKN